MSINSASLLTKNPSLPVRDGYIPLLQELATIPADHPRFADFKGGRRPALQVHVSLALWREEARRVYEPYAPDLEDRKAGTTWRAD